MDTFRFTILLQNLAKDPFQISTEAFANAVKELDKLQLQQVANTLMGYYRDSKEYSVEDAVHLINMVEKIYKYQ